jgi:hypothetical protein
LPGEFEAIERFILQPVNREDDRIEKTVPNNAQNIFILSSQSVIQSEFSQKEHAGCDLSNNLITTPSPRNEPRESEGLGGIQKLDV